MIYGLLSTLIFIIILPFWLLLGVFRPKLVAGFWEKLGFFKTPLLKKGRTIIFYGVSVGEVNAIENLIKKTREQFPQTNLILLTGTKTGQEIAHKKLADICDFIGYFPFDFPFCIKTMLSKLKPDAVFITETELWPNFAYVLNKKNIPLFIINARLSDRTYSSYKKLKFIFSPILKKYTAIYPQSKQDMEKFISLGANPETTTVMGNLKFDIKKPDLSDFNFNKNNISSKIILAGSTRTGEEEIILNVFEELKGVDGEIPNLKLIIAPRHLDSKYNINKCGRRSKGDDFEKNDIILLDTMGELNKFYSVCDVAFIGGSFRGKSGDNLWGRGVGGQNPLEATIFNKPVVSGPSIHNFKDIYAILTSFEAGMVVKTKEELKEYLFKLLTDEDFYKKTSQNCEKVFEQNKGALNFVIKIIQNLA